ncbi:MAG: uroporphyrinogen decarboxylase family protein [Bryobacteraceae bacterium]|nr:uroporphyrinogen decarboxylase family protein [Bryobacteraceae bacterium]
MLSSRDRVLATLNHREPDRVAVDLSGHRSSGISAIAYPKLRAALGLEPRTVYVYDPIQQLAIVDQDVLDLFGVDTIELGREFCHEDRWWVDWSLPNGTPCKMPVWAAPEKRDDGWILRAKDGHALGRMPDGALHFDQIYWPLLDGEEDLGKLDDAFQLSMWSVFGGPPQPDISVDDLAAGARRLRERTDRAIIGLFGGNLLEIGQMLFKMDQFLMMLAGEPQRVHRFLDALVEYHLASLERFLGAVGPYIDIILFGDDLGAQNGPQISPRMYREFFQPREKIMWARAKQLADVKVMLHCCGAVRPLLPGLIEAGLDAINPVQISCRGMEAEGLKRDFGKDLTFWGGGCDTQSVLPQGTPEQVRAHVLRQCELMAPGGGFVFQQVHNIMANVPPENIVAMYGAVREFDTRNA